MKYYTDFLNELNKGRLYPIYLFYGPETYLRKEAVQKIKEQVLTAGDFNYAEVDGEQVLLSEIVSLAEMTPFLGDTRILVVKSANKIFAPRKYISRDSDTNMETLSEKTDSDEEVFIKYLASPNPTTCLILEAGENIDKRKKIYKEVLKHGKVIEFTLLNYQNLCSWLIKKSREAGKKISPGVAREIVYRTGNNLHALSAEIQKVISYAGDKTIISMEDVIAITPTIIEENIFAVVDAIGEKKPARAIEGIKSLLKQKQQPSVILSMITRQIRLIILAGDALRSGKKHDVLASLMGVHPFVARKIAVQQKNFQQQQLVDYIHYLHQLDVSIKSGEQDFLPGIEMFIYEVCR
jgi:DNA polymerase-3 subunit delta